MRPLLPLLAAALASLAPAAASAQDAAGTALVDELNRVRGAPGALAQELRAYRKLYRGDTVWFPGDPVGLKTREGTAAVDEAIGFLRRQAPVRPLVWSDMLARAARDHIADQGPRGATGHKGRDGGTASDRVVRNGGFGNVGEAITYGPRGATAVVRELIVDDGVRDRSHRTLAYMPQFGFAGAACGPHRAYGTMCVVVFGRTFDGR